MIGSCGGKEAAERLHFRILAPRSLQAGGPWTTSMPGRATCGAAKARRQAQLGGQLRRQLPPLRSGGGDHHLGALVEAGPRIVEGVDGGPGLEVQVAPPVDPLQQVAEEGRNIVDIERRSVLARGDQQVLGQGQLPLAEQGVAWVSSSCGRRSAA